MKKENCEGRVISVIGDSSIASGIAFEGLNFLGQDQNSKPIIILNDNQMSIGKNTGSLSRYLSRLTMTSHYQNFRRRFDYIVSKIPFFGKSLTNFVFRLKRGLKGIVFSNNLFADLGFEYVGPMDGHNIQELERLLNRVKKLEKVSYDHSH